MPVYLMRERDLSPIVSKNRTVVSISSESVSDSHPLEKIKRMAVRHRKPETLAERIMDSLRKAVRRSRKEGEHRVLLRLNDQEDLRLLKPEQWSEILEQSEDFASENKNTEIIFILPEDYELPLSKNLTEEISERLETSIQPDYPWDEAQGMSLELPSRAIPESLSESAPEEEDAADLFPASSFTEQSRPIFSSNVSAAITKELDFDDLDLDFQDLEDGFSARLLSLIDESRKSDAEIYKKANVDRRLFSKIRSNPNYHPAKKTVLAFAIALGLDLNQTEQLLQSAGYALSPASRSDRIIEYCIEKRIYDVMQVNQILFHFDQPLIGS